MLELRRGRVHEWPKKFEVILRNSGMELSGLETASSVFMGRSWGVRGKDVGRLLYAATWSS